MSNADYDVAYCDACERCHLNGICPLTDKAQKVVSMTDAGWASSKPTEAGWYWWRFREGKDPVVMKIGDDHIAKTNVFTIGTSVLLIDELPGEWLGPISPDTYRQGRVAGLREASKLADEYGAKEWDKGIQDAMARLSLQLERQAQEGSDGN